MNLLDYSNQLKGMFIKVVKDRTGYDIVDDTVIEITSNSESEYATLYYQDEFWADVYYSSNNEYNFIVETVNPYYIEKEASSEIVFANQLSILAALIDSAYKVGSKSLVKTRFYND